MKKIIVASLVTVLLSGCSLVPNYQRPEAPMPASWSQAGTGTTQMARSWWESFGDAELNRLYRGAVRQFGRDARADTLRAAQRAWLAWDAAETRSDLAQQADGGSIGPVTVSNLAMQRRRARACMLFNMQDEP